MGEDIPPDELTVDPLELSIVFANTQRTVDDLADALITRGYAADRLRSLAGQALRGLGVTIESEAAGVSGGRHG